MNSSVKFFAPSTTGGLPLPGCPLGGCALPELELELLLSDPQAASAMASATVRRASIALYHVLDVIRVPSPLVLRRLEHCALGLDLARPAKGTRRRSVLQICEEPIHRERERGNQQRCRDDPLEPIAGLVRDDVSQ